MTYLVHTAHAQLVALGLSCVGWIFTGMALGLIQWRVWHVSDSEVISSGVAWVGVWRACFHSRTAATPGLGVMHCEHIGLAEAFTPPDIAAAQVLMLLSLVAGLCGNAAGVYTMRNVYLGVVKDVPIRLSFCITGALCLLAAAMSLIPLLWNLTSVVTNQAIPFPPEFKMPQAPDSQQVGSGIGVGIIGAVLMTAAGVTFCTYRFPAKPRPGNRPSLGEQVHPDGVSPAGLGTDGRGARDNPSFQSDEHFPSLT